MIEQQCIPFAEDFVGVLSKSGYLQKQSYTQLREKSNVLQYTIYNGFEMLFSTPFFFQAD